MTITVPHDLTDRLSKLLDAERAAWKRVTQSATWQWLKRRLRIAGHIIALEFTWGDENGWHPEPERSDEELAAAGIGGNLIVVIQCPVWSHARTAGLEHAVLVAAEDGGLEAVNALISEAISGEACLAPTLSGCTIE